MRRMIIVPILSLLGNRELALQFNGDPTYNFIATMMALLFVTVIIITGMKRYATFQKWSFWIGNAGLIGVIALLFSGDHVRPVFSVLGSLAAWGGMIAVALVASWYPARTALRLSPLKAIQSDS